jgi:hypothetical protein
MVAIRILAATQTDRVVIKPGQREAVLPIQQAGLKNMWRIPIVGIDMNRYRASRKTRFMAAG